MPNSANLSSRGYTPRPLGKKPAREGAIRFHLTQFVDFSLLPPIPRRFGHEQFIPSDAWGELGNDKWGNCVWAGGDHETMMMLAQSGTLPPSDARSLFTEATALQDYSDQTGFSPSNPSSDQGTDMEEAASYRRQIGLLDAQGNRHKILAYVTFDARDHKQLYAALYLFSAVGIGIRFPASAMRQFDAHSTWTPVRGSHDLGGHYVPLVARRNTLLAVTWGRLQGLTIRFLDQYCDECIAYLSPEVLNQQTQKTQEGLDLQGLQQALASLH